MVVAGDEPRRKPEPGLEPARRSAVLAGDPPHRAEYGESPRRKIVEIADRGRDDEEASSGRALVHSANRIPRIPVPPHIVIGDNGRMRTPLDYQTAFAGRRLAVTGARGFLGARLTDRLVGLGARVVGFDRAPGARENGNAVFVCGDLADPAALGEALDGAEVIFHLAAAAGHRESMERPLADFEGNVLGTLRLLRAAAERAPAARIVFASTRQLYGRAHRLPAPENHPVEPPDVHAVHKETAEHLGRHFSKQRSIPFTALRLTNLYGPAQPTRGPAAGLTGRFLRQALDGEGITILGDPNLLRDFVHVDDAVDGFLRCAMPAAPAGLWNLGAPPVSLGEFAAAIFRALDEPPQIRTAPLPEDFQSLAIGDFHSDWSAIRAELGWEPSVDLERGLRGTVRAFREHPAAR